MGVRQFSKRTQSWAASETKTSYAMQEKIMWHAFWLIIALLHRVSVLCFCFVDSCRNMFISPTHVSIFPVNRWLRWHGRAPRQYKAGINYHVCNMSENVIYMFFYMSYCLQFGFASSLHDFQTRCRSTSQNANQAKDLATYATAQYPCLHALVAMFAEHVFLVFRSLLNI